MVALNKEFVVSLTRRAGFSIVGFADVENLHKEAALLSDWLNRGYQAGMKYMERNLDKKEDVRLLLPSARSVISLAMNYYPGEFGIVPESAGKVSRYAWGKDYHEVIGDRCRHLIEEIKKIAPEFEAIFNVDSGPVMDKAWAVRAGIGWLGKNSNVINPSAGSWFFLATIICNWEFESSAPLTDHCGTCTACIDACPTKAITEEYVVDSNKCISYLTIENKNEIPEEFRDKMERWAFGCDICQEVCPWNIKFTVETEIEDFKGTNVFLNQQTIDAMNENEFKIRYSDSPILRPKLRGIRRNLNFLSGD